jgi:hypothetical protein
MPHLVNTSDQALFVSPAETSVRTITPSPEAYLESPDINEPTVIRDYFGDDIRSPQAFLVERLPAHRTVRAHFHPVDQFQIFFPAPGVWYKRGPIQHLTVHYADAFVTYGPFGTKEAPMSFFTLRFGSTGQTSYMPDSIDDLPRIEPRGRNVEAHVHLPSGSGFSGFHKDELIPASKDGLAAYVSNLGPELPVDTSISSHSLGHYYYVLAGSITTNGREYEGGSLGWRSQDFDFSGGLMSGSNGCSVLVMQFPSTHGRVVSARRRGSLRT